MKDIEVTDNTYVLCIFRSREYPCITLVDWIWCSEIGNYARRNEGFCVNGDKTCAVLITTIVSYLSKNTQCIGRRSIISFLLS